MDFTRSSRMNICIFKEGKGHCSPLSHPQSFSLYCLFFKAFALRVQKLSPLYYDFQGVFFIVYISMNKKESTLKILCQNQDRMIQKYGAISFFTLAESFYSVKYGSSNIASNIQLLIVNIYFFCKFCFFRLKPEQYKKCQYCRLFKKTHLETHKNKTN